MKDLGKKSSGPRKRTRKIFRQKTGYRPTITKFIQEFNTGQTVVIDQEPSSHRGMPFKRFKGRVGKVIGRRGKAFIIEIREGNKTKKIISRPEHLRVV